MCFVNTDLCVCLFVPGVYNKDNNNKPYLLLLLLLLSTVLNTDLAVLNTDLAVHNVQI